MAISMTLRVSGIDLEDATVGHTLAAQLPHLLWQGDRTYATATFDIEERNAVTHTLDVARTLEASIPGVEILGTDRDLVSTTEIASRVGVSREGARKWTKEADFPAPFTIIGGRTAAWPWATVVEWLLSSRGIDMQEALPSESLLTQIDNCLFRNPDVTTVQWREVPTNTEVEPPHRPARRGKVIHISEWKSMNQARSFKRPSGHATVMSPGKFVVWQR